MIIEYKNKDIILGICLFIIFFNTLIIIYNPDCPFHVDYVQYIKSINSFYDKKVVEDTVNGKFLYVYLMALLLTPFKLLNLNLFNGMVFVTGLFQALIVYLFYKYTKSLLKTILMSTTLTFLTFIGNAESVMLSSVFLLLFFIYRDKPYSAFFITIASFIRLDFAVYYLFARNKTAILPIAVTFLQWLNGRFYIDSDFGINPYIVPAIFVFLFSYGVYFALFMPFAESKKSRLDCLILFLIVIFFIVFLKFPSQKVFFFPVILSFMLYDIKLPNYRHMPIGLPRMKYILIVLVIINIVLASATLIRRNNICSADSFYIYSELHDSSIHFGVFQPYLDYRSKHIPEPYEYRIAIAKSEKWGVYGSNCKNKSDYLIAEDWRNAQLYYLPYKFCLEKWREENANHTP